MICEFAWSINQAVSKSTTALQLEVTQIVGGTRSVSQAWSIAVNQSIAFFAKIGCFKSFKWQRCLSGKPLFNHYQLSQTLINRLISEDWPSSTRFWATHVRSILINLFIWDNSPAGRLGIMNRSTAGATAGPTLLTKQIPIKRCTEESTTCRLRPGITDRGIRSINMRINILGIVMNCEPKDGSVDGFWMISWSRPMI